MKRFFVEKDILNDGKYVVTVKIVVYRQRLGKYPPFLKDFGTPKSERDGYTTKFWFLFKDESGNDLENLELHEANKIAEDLETKYAEKFAISEDTGIWDENLFSNLVLIFYK